jgi:hypothetical protein
MGADVDAFDDIHPMGEAATHPIARFSRRPAALLFLAGNDPARRRALPAVPKIAHSGAFNRGF